ncbi:hypothetical protein QM012_005554 [Aureobasidium pullulans]|uniref:F-box domain-containing protein n=1 Tax=Aureobasidium pullulans TaxID=5580 RepID=A0ABR0T5R9_AURPU
MTHREDLYVPPHWDPEESPLLFLPDEVKEMVVNNLTPENSDTLHFSMASPELRMISLAKFWSFVKEDRTLINLQRHPHNVQQTYANFIRELHMTINDPRIDVSHLRFNSLERLALRLPAVNQGSMVHDISYLLGPHLTHLKLYDVNNTSSTSNAAQVENFLPFLNRSPGLKHLDIGLRIDAIPTELLSGVQSCPDLETLHIHHQGSSASSLKIDHEVLKHVCLSKKIKNFYWSQCLSDETVLRALEDIPEDQGVMLGLSHISLRISSEAAALLLPRLHSIESLVLYISDEGNILQSVATMPRLTRLHLQYEIDMVLDRVVLQPLQSMKLTRLTIRPDDPVDRELDADAITLDDLSYIFGSNNTLRRLEVFWDMHEDYFREALIDVMWRLTQAYPALEDLEIPYGVLKFPLAADTSFTTTVPAIMFPRLKYLKVLKLQQPSDESQ